MIEALFLAHEKISGSALASKNCVKLRTLHLYRQSYRHSCTKFRRTYRRNQNSLTTSLNTTRCCRYCRKTASAVIAGDDEEKLAEAKGAFAEAKDTVFRELILEGKRVDGRDTKTVRPIVVDLDVLPKSHGSVVFTRGETQGLVTTTLGTADDEQLIDGIKILQNSCCTTTSRLLGW